jgi:hypothetical protein
MELQAPRGLNLFFPKTIIRIISFPNDTDSERQCYELEIDGKNVLYDIYTNITENSSAKLVYEIWRRPNLHKFVLFIDVKVDMNSGELYVLSRKINRNNKPGDVNPIIIGIYLKKFLTQIHSLGLTHGDFTDTNILWNGGNPYVIDFERSVDQIDFPDDFLYFKMIDYADLVITLNKLNGKFYRDASQIAQKIKEYEDDIMNYELDTDKKSILEKLNNDMMEKLN